jgi:hypothetical protein
MSRLTHTREAAAAWWLQTWLAIDQLANAFILGLLAIVMALATAAKQEVAYCDETLSAHCWRAYERGRPWGRLFMPMLDGAFSLWQRDEQGNRVRNHCERAFQSEKARRHLPRAYSETRGEDINGR